MSNGDNVTPFPMSPESLQRAILSLAEKYLGNSPPPFDPEKSLWDQVIQTGLMRQLPMKAVIEEANEIVLARRNFFNSEK
jgi:hypothetical protein